MVAAAVILLDLKNMRTKAAAFLDCGMVGVCLRSDKAGSKIVAHVAHIGRTIEKA